MGEWGRSRQSTDRSAFLCSTPVAVSSARDRRRAAATGALIPFDSFASNMTKYPSHLHSAHLTPSPPQYMEKLDRKLKKPMMERKRRQRMNDCLTTLKQIILQVDPQQNSKLEKADILERTVKLFHMLQQQNVMLLQQVQTFGGGDAQLAKFKGFEEGFKTCYNTVMQQLASTPLDQCVCPQKQPIRQLLCQNMVDHLRTEYSRISPSSGILSHAAAATAVPLPTVPGMPGPSTVPNRTNTLGLNSLPIISPHLAPHPGFLFPPQPHPFARLLPHPHIPSFSNLIRESTASSAPEHPPPTKSETVSDSDPDEDTDNEEQVDVESCDKTVDSTTKDFDQSTTMSNTTISLNTTTNDSGVSSSASSPNVSHSTHSSSFTSINSLLQK